MLNAAAKQVPHLPVGRGRSAARHQAQALAAPPSAAELLKLVDEVIRFVQTGLEGRERRSP
jgi:hypothetical protein